MEGDSMAKSTTTETVGQELNKPDGAPKLTADQRRRRKMLRTVKALGTAIDPIGGDNQETLVAIRAMVNKLLAPAPAP